LVIPALLETVLLTTLIHLLLPILSPPWPASWGAFFVFPLLALALVAAERGLYLLVLDQPVFQRRVLIVGAGWAGCTIAEALEENGNGTYKLVGFVDDDPEKIGRRVEIGEGKLERGDWRRETGKGRLEKGKGKVSALHSPPSNLHSPSSSLKVLGDRTALSELIERHQINTLVVAITDEVDGELLQILVDCLEYGVNILPMPVLYEQLTGRVPVEHVGENWYVAMPLHHPGAGALWPMTKRLFDLISAGIGALLLTLALPFIAAAIYIDSPGPIFYTQERVGKGGKHFKVYKFRSMIPEAEKGGKAVWAKENDDRVTRVGRILRKLHMDEFPQFFNILKGEMSAVGPRPERPEFVQELAEEIPFYRVRHAVKPGMAGWGLVKQGYGSSKEDAMLKLQYDLYYIKHQSLWVDLVILLKTVADTLTFAGRA
jgi:exopolysaccharide biosynthesis polyprenyl glycosylphosphotransferase